MAIDPASITWDDAGIKWDDEKPKASGASRFVSGLADPIHGGAQLLENAVRSVAPGAVKTINALNNKLADYGIVARLPDGGVDQQVKEREASLKSEGIDWPRLAGNVLSPATMALGASGAATLPGRIAAGAGLGSVSGALMPNEGGAADKLKQMAVGGIGGAVVPALMGAASRVISPKASTNPQVALLQREGVRPTIGQTLGGMANRVEERSMSLPIVGDSIRSARLRAEGDLNNAVANRALNPIGESVSGGAQGRELVSQVQQKLSDAYETLLPKITAKADQTFTSEVGSLRSMVANGSIDPNAAKTFERILRNDVLSKFRGQQALTGQTLKAVESDLGQKIAQFGSSSDSDARLVASALREVQSSLRGLVERNNPQLADELKAINTGWANFKRLERAASYIGAEDGSFNASQLQSAVKALDRSKDKGKFARGDAYMQDLSDAAKSVMGAKVPNSGTADRMFNGAAIGASLTNPSALAGLLVAPAAYSAPGQALLRGLVTARPQAAQPVAGLLNQTAPMFGPAGGLLGLQMLEQ